MLSDANLIEGEYGYEIVFIDPITGCVVESNILQDTYDTIKSEITINGQATTGEAKGSIEIMEGELEISATAVLPSGKEITTGSQLRFTVSLEQPPAVEIRLATFDGKPVQKGEQLIAGEYQYEVLLTDPLIGGSVSDDLFNRTSIAVEIVQNGNVQSGDVSGGIITVEEGTFAIRAVSSLPNGEQNESGEQKYRVVKKLNPISLEIDGKGTIELLELEEVGSELVVIGTIDGQPLTAQQWEAVNIKVIGSNNIEWTLKKGDKVATWVLSPKYVSTGMLSTDTGDTQVTVDAALTQDGQTVKQTAKKQIQVNNISGARRFWEWFKLNWSWVIAIILIALILWAYMSKKRFKKAVYKPGRTPSGIAPEQKLRIKIDTLSRVLPFVAEKGTLSGYAKANGKHHRFTVNVVAVGNRMRIARLSKMLNEDGLRLGTTRFRYRIVKGKNVLEPNLSEKPEHFSYRDDIVFSVARKGNVTWKNSVH